MTRSGPSMPGTVWTIGHSNRSLADFLDLLRGASIGRIADVRRFPGSRKHPQFGRETFPASLAEAGIDYRHLPGLGGRRGGKRKDSPNHAWRVESFNAYADHMDSPEFLAALDELMDLAADRPTAVMCSEALPWRCHRRLIADALIVRGWQVRDILGRGKIDLHALTPFAHVEGLRLTYPADPPSPTE